MSSTPHDIVPITIDKTPRKSPNPTSGAALYALGEVKPNYDLWRETRGQGDDEFIANDGTSYTLNPGDRFFSAQQTLNPGINGER